MFIWPLAFILLASFANSSQNIKLLEFETFSKNNFELLKNNNLYVLVVYGKLDKEKNEKLGLILPDLKSSIDQMNQNENQVEFNLMIEDDRLTKRYDLKAFPTILFFRNGRHLTYNSDMNLKSLEEWFDENQQPSTFELNDASFEHDTQATTGATTGDWFVLFYKSECQMLPRIVSEWEYASKRLKNQVSFAYVDIDSNPRLKKRFDLKSSPNFYFFRQGQLFKYEINNFDSNSLESFASKFYKNVKAEKIPRELTAFDTLVDDIVKKLKEENLLTQTNIALIGGGLVFVIVIILYSILKASDKKEKSN